MDGQQHIESREWSRRDFLKAGAALAALLGMGAGASSALGASLEELSSGAVPVVWLQAQSCSGCSVSFLNTASPSPSEILTQYISLVFHPTISAATGERALEICEKSAEVGGHFLVVEGAMPLGMPEACMMGHGHKSLNDWVAELAEGCLAVIALGSCATNGGIPGAEGNPTGAVSVPEFLKRKGIDKPLIRLPGCPAHPDWLVGTLACIVMQMRKGRGVAASLPELDELGRPTMFFGRLVHDQCTRFADYEREKFAKFFGDQGCLFKLGCLGPVTHADCTTRQWNGGVNTCIRAGAPCIGCASTEFAHRAGTPFYLYGEPAPTKERKA